MADIPALEKKTYAFFVDDHFCEYTEFEGLDYYEKGILTVYSNSPEDLDKVKAMFEGMFNINYRMVNEVSYYDLNIAVARK
jgi:hypothetical protein